MLRTRIFVAPVFLLGILTFAIFLPRTTKSSANLRRVTNTTDEIINLNPSLSGDGRHIVFESTGDLAHSGDIQGFHAVRAALDTEPPALSEIARTRVVAPGISQDGSAVVFSSTEDLVGQNADHNSEIFLQARGELRQVTNTSPGSVATRTSDGSFQPSITDDGRCLAFSSNRDLVGLNSDLNFEVYLFETNTGTFSQLTDSNGIAGTTESKISGDGSALVLVRDDNTVPGLSRSLLLYDRTTRDTTTIAEREPRMALSYGRAISDNGLRVVYSRETNEHQSQVFLYDSVLNSSRQLTALGIRVSDVPLNPTISGDGKRIAFATRRRVSAPSDGSVELYVYDVPTAQFMQLTDAPANVTAEVVSSLSDDGSLVAFNFPRVISGGASSDEGNNCEIYLGIIPSRPAFGPVAVLNGASLGNEPAPTALPRDGIVIARGNGLAGSTLNADQTVAGSFPRSLAGTTVTVNGLEAELFYVSPTEVSFVIPAGASSGSAEIVITNGDGFQSRANVVLATAAPGIFTIGGQGRGEGVILDADKLLAGPFDPGNSRLRLIVFATGVRNAASVSVAIAGRPTTVEVVMPAPDLSGLDEIHVLVPADLRGAGKVNLVVEADGRKSNSVTAAFSGDSLREIVINEILADPPDSLAGDSNHDGTRSATDDEFVELINSTNRDLDLTGYQLQTRALDSTADIVRHRFSTGTVLPAGTAIVIFGGGNPDASDPTFAGANVVEASTGGLALVNSGSVVTLRDASASIVTLFAYGGTTGLAGDENQSLTRLPDVTGRFVLHKLAPEAGQRAFSPGTRVNGTPFAPTPAVSSIVVSPGSAALLVGQEQQFSARAFAENGDQLSDLIFNWESASATVATIDGSGLAKAIGAGTAAIMASARGVRSLPATLLVSQPSPSPTPTPMPSPSPTPPPTPTPTPSPSPTPSPTVSPSPSPSPTPAPSPTARLVISQVYGGGGNSSAPFRNDFIEIFNSGGVGVDLSGWSVQYAGATSTSWSATNLTSSTLAPGQYYLVQQGSGGVTGQALPPADVTGNINMAATAGKVALVNSPTPLTGACPSSGAIIDMVGYGSSANCFEGTGPTTAPGNTLGIQRGGNGCVDTQESANDFAVAAPDPRNRIAPLNSCMIATIQLSRSFRWDSVREWIEKLLSVRVVAPISNKNCNLKFGLNPSALRLTSDLWHWHTTVFAFVQRRTPDGPLL